MTEYDEPLAPEDLDESPSGEDRAGGGVSEGEPVRTGVATVDAVLADLDGLDEAPVGDHLAVFEGAHDALRSALDVDPGDPA